MSRLSPSLPVLAFITNGASTQNKKDKDWWTPHLAGAANVHVLQASGPGDMRAAVAEAAALKAEILAVNGGDGTVDLTFAALLNQGPFTTPPALALLPAGKTNMTAAAWSRTKDKHTALRHLLRLRETNSLQRAITHRPILTLDQGTGGAPLRGAFLGAADVVDGILFCRKHIYPLNLPNTISHGMAVSVLLWRSLLARPTATLIEATWDDATTESGQFFFLGAMTLDRLILGLSPTPSKITGDIHYISLKPGLAAVFSAVPRLLTGNVPTGYKRNVHRAKKLKLVFDGAYTLDGELYEARKDQPLIITADETLPMIDLSPS